MKKIYFLLGLIILLLWLTGCSNEKIITNCSGSTPTVEYQYIYTGFQFVNHKYKIGDCVIYEVRDGLYRKECIQGYAFYDFEGIGGESDAKGYVIGAGAYDAEVIQEGKILGLSK